MIAKDMGRLILGLWIALVSVFFCAPMAQAKPMEYVYGPGPAEADRFYLEGLATWYHHPGWPTRGREWYRSDSPTCAVDDHLWPYVRNKLLRITNLETGEWLILRVNDTGHLSEARQGVVVDLPRDTHRQLSGDGDTFCVSVVLAEDVDDLVLPVVP